MIDQARSDASLRTGLFWGILLVSLGSMAMSHYLEHRFSYRVTYTESGQTVSIPPRYGSYGFQLAEEQTSHPDSRKVLVLGNSVYQTCQIIERMQHWANRDNENIEFINLAITGSGIHDHIVQLAKCIASQPDLILLSYFNWDFVYGVRNELPRFRTDANLLAFDLDAVSEIPFSFYFREFTLNEAGDAIVSSLFPLKRLEWLLRRKVDEKINRVLFYPPWFRKAFPLPSLNLLVEWIDKPEIVKAKIQDQPIPYDHIDALLAELVSIAQKQQVPLLMIRQESGGRFLQPDMSEKVCQACDGYEKAYCVDFQSDFDIQSIPDYVHPVGERAREEYAQRHYRAVLDTLDLQ